MPFLFEALRAEREGRMDDSRRLLAEVAREGDLRGAFLLAQALRDDPTAAAQWYRWAAEQGHAAAARELAERCARGHGVPRDMGEAMRWYRAAAERGDVAAIRMVGLLLLRGGGGQRDPGGARDWLAAAAGRGDAAAALALGRMLELGDGTAEDPEAAARWYFEASAASETAEEARVAIERLRPRLRELAAGGSAGAQYRLGRVVSDPAEAARWVEAAARQGHPEACHTLAVFLREGRGVPADLEASFRWCLTAAQAGVRAAQHDMGYMRVAGIGMTADREEARRWYERAADQGDAQSSYDLWVTAGRSAAEREEAGRRLLAAAQGGYAPAMHRLGLAYRDGDGVPRDLVQAARWLISALDHGQAGGVHDLHQLARELTPDQVRVADRLADSDGSAVESLIAAAAG
jgi:uncharacterized protein